MKKITLLATALLVASSLFATPTLKADRLSSVQSKVADFKVLKTELPAQLKKANAPTATAAITNLTVSAQDGYGTVSFKWQTAGTSDYFGFTLYTAAGQEVAFAGYYGIANFLEDANTKTCGWNLSELLFNATDGQLYACPPGQWKIGVEGAKAVDGKAQVVEEEIISDVFTIVSYDVTNFAATVSEDKKHLTINFDVLTLPANHFYGVEITEGTNTLYENYSTQTNPTLPLTVDVEEGKTYSVSVAPLKVNLANGKLYYASDNQINETVTIGVNKLTPVGLKAVVSGDTVFMTWSAEEVAPYYWVEIFDSEGQIVDLSTKYTNTSSYGAILYPDDYTWTVQAMTVSGSSLYPTSDVVAGTAFTTEDILAPVVTDVTISEITTHSAKVSFKATDRWTDATEMMAAIYTGGFLEVAYPELQEDGTFAADISMIPGDGDMEPLKPSTTYEFTINVFDAFYNMAKVPFSFTTLADTTDGLADLAAAGITYENGIIFNANGEQLRVYNAAGQLVAESTRNIDMNTFAAGVYVVNAQQTTFKIAK